MNNYCIISHKYKFIYVPIAKVACTTLLNRVAEIIHGKDISKIKNVFSHREVHTQRKKIFGTSTSEVNRNSQKAIDAYPHYFKFAFVRNPFSRVHSCYVDKISMNTYGFDRNLVTRYEKMSRGMSFSEFLTIVQGTNLEDMDEHFRPQYSFIAIENMDFIGKIEDLDNDWRRVEARILGHETDVQLPVFNKTQEVDYYDDESETLVRQIYEKDFQLFGYSTRKVKPKNMPLDLPLIINCHQEQRIFPFNDAILKKEEEAYEVVVTGNKPILIIPYFKTEKNCTIKLQGEITSPCDTTLTVYYTTEEYLESPEKFNKQVNISKGHNRLNIEINDEKACGRLRLKLSDRKGVFFIHELIIDKNIPPWNEEPSQMTGLNQKLFALPEYVQKKKNLFSMCNFKSIYMPIMQILNPKEITEIGTDQGNNTEILKEYCIQNDAHLVIVDPAGNDFYAQDKIAAITIKKEKSIEYLEGQQSASDVYFVDGDHNYDTVSLELQLINKLSLSSNKPVVVFMHDISWPWAYRDLYYSLGAEVGDEDITSDEGVSLYDAATDNKGIPSTGQYAFRKFEGGEKNGVRRALEDFLKVEQHWNLVDIHSLYGLGILWSEQHMNARQLSLMREVGAHFDYFKEFLSILEWNRLALYSQIYKNSQVWQANQDYIKKLENKLKMQSKAYKRKKIKERIFGHSK